MIRIIKIGGKLIENDAVLNGLCDELSACYRDSVLVREVWPDNCLRVWGSGPV